jgi:hypothetical protein
MAYALDKVAKARKTAGNRDFMGFSTGNEHAMHC